MKLAKSLPLFLNSLLALSMSVTTAGATSLLLDFGPTAVQPADALLSPGHTIGAVPGTEITWNQITGDTAALVYGDGTSATGVTLELGRSQAGVDTIDFADNGFTVNPLGTAVNTGVYVGSSPVKDGIFGGSGGVNNLALGVRVNGLPAGTYTIIVHGRNSNTGLIASLLFYAINGPDSATYSFSVSDDTAAVLNSAPPLTTGFIEGDNYGVLTVTLGAGESLYIASEGTVSAEMRGFFNAIQIVSGIPDLPARISAQPANRTVLESATVLLTAGTSGTEPLLRQWRFNGTNVLSDGPNISGATSNTLILRSVTSAMAGAYSLFVSNALGTDTSSDATLTVIPALNTEQMTNLWSLAPGDRPYLSTANTERGIGFNSTTTNLLLVSRTPSLQVVVLNALTGEERHFLDVSGVVDGTFALNHVRAGDDGVVYAANLTTSATSPPFKIYRWANDSSDPGNTPVPVFQGDPSDVVQGNLRWGDNFDVRGAGADTQILIGPGSGGTTNVVILRTVSGLDFQTEIPPTVIAISGLPSALSTFTTGFAFGPGDNTFWVKPVNGGLHLVEFDLNTGLGTVVRSYSTLVSGSVRGRT
jgi:hypothetical protein